MLTGRLSSCQIVPVLRNALSTQYLIISMFLWQMERIALLVMGIGL